MAAPVIQLFVNPKAGSASRRRVAALRRALESAGAQVIVEEGLAVAETATRICAVGGDGTLRHVAAALRASGRSRPMSIFPSGTVNLLARECGYGRDANAFARRLLGEPRRIHYCVRLGDTAMFTCASVGPDSLAIAALSPRLKRWVGRAAYVAAFLKVLAGWQRPSLRVRHDGGELACEALYIAKGRLFAGPWSFAPNASVEEPVLNVVALRRARRRDFLAFMLLLAFRGDLGRNANLVRFTCTALEVEAGSPLPLQADGDIVTYLPARLEIDPAPLDFV